MHIPTYNLILPTFTPPTNPHPQVPLLQTSSPAQVVAHLLRTHLGPNLHSHIFIDFCAGGGGPTPSIERHLNTTTTTKQQTNGNRASQEPLHFVLTDLHPHADMWAQAAAQAAAPGAISYVAEPVDAADVPRELIRRYTGAGGGAGGEKKVFRLFNLAFHHFDDELARRILSDTVEGGGEGFG